MYHQLKNKSLVINTQSKKKFTNIHLSSFLSKISTTVTYRKRANNNEELRARGKRSDQKNPKNIYFGILERSFFLLNDFTCCATICLYSSSSSPSPLIQNGIPSTEQEALKTIFKLMLINSQVLSRLPFKSGDGWG